MRASERCKIEREDYHVCNIATFEENKESSKTISNQMFTSPAKIRRYRAHTFSSSRLLSLTANHSEHVI